MMRSRGRRHDALNKAAALQQPARNRRSKCCTATCRHTPSIRPHASNVARSSCCSYRRCSRSTESPSSIPQRAGELVVRRQIVEEGLRLMSRLHMVEFRYTERGILYATREDASLFVQLIRSSYGRILKERAKWLIDYVTESDDEFLAKLIREKVGRWTADFQGEI